ncbi:MAG: hemolysin family protein [Chlamydiota bacterium]
MHEAWKFFLILTVCCIAMEAFFSMLEMACVSFNKVRLQYYVSNNHRRAKWLNYLLNRPPVLFGTILICVNLALEVGSESSRRFYEALGLNPDWAALTQIFLVLIFAELSPLFAARRNPEYVAMFGIPVVYAASIVLRPLIWLLDRLCFVINHILGTKTGGGLYLTRDELQNIVEEREEPATLREQKEGFNTVTANIFSLKNKTAKELMVPLKEIKVISSACTLGEMRSFLKSIYTPFLPIYHRRLENIVAIAYPRDLLRLPEHETVRSHARSPWFITENTSILQILKQFRKNNQSVSIVLDEAGLARGVLTLDEIVDEIFGQSDNWSSIEDIAPRTHHVVVDRDFPGDMLIADFNRQFHVHLEGERDETLSELVTKILGHAPTKGEAVHVDQFELTVEETSLLGAKVITIRSIF